MRRRAAAGDKTAGTKPPVMTDVREVVGKPVEESFLDDDSTKAPFAPAASSLEAAGEAAQNEADERKARHAARAEGAPKKAEELEMGGGFGRVITHQFRPTDAYLEYTELRTMLRSEGRASQLSYGQLVDALDVAEDAAHRGAELCAQAKVMHDEFDFNAKVIAAALRKNAVEELERRKAEFKAENKTAGKAITNDDIEAEIASQNPDEWLELESRRGKARRSIALFEDLAVRLAERAKDLRQMVARARDPQ
jgi:hypothetical protein